MNNITYELCEVIEYECFPRIQGLTSKDIRKITWEHNTLTNVTVTNHVLEGGIS